VNLPSSVIYGLAFNTFSFGANPTGIHGPYESLNFGFQNQLPSVGTDIPTVGYTDSAYDPGVGGAGNFSQRAGNFDPADGITPVRAAVRAAVEFTAVPEPGSIFLLGIGLAFVIYSARKRLIA